MLFVNSVTVGNSYVVFTHNNIWNVVISAEFYAPLFTPPPQ